MKLSKRCIGYLLKYLLFTLLVITSSQSFAEGKTTFYHYDLLGSPVATTDEQGKVIWREEYSPWGEKLLKEDASHDNVRDYTGHVHDKETGLTYMQARYYDPQIGRFMGVDPVGFQEGNTISFNRYGYANNNPHRFTDPNGEYGEDAFDDGWAAENAFGPCDDCSDDSGPDPAELAADIGDELKKDAKKTAIVGAKVAVVGAFIYGGSKLPAISASFTESLLFSNMGVRAGMAGETLIANTSRLAMTGANKAVTSGVATYEAGVTAHMTLNSAVYSATARYGAAVTADALALDFTSSMFVPGAPAFTPAGIAGYATGDFLETNTWK